MTAPNNYALEIKVAGVDVTAFVPYDTLNFDDYIHSVSSFRFTIENPVGITPAKNDLVVIKAKNLTDSPIIFLGYIIELENKKRDNGITVIYEVECADMKIRLQKTVLDVDYLLGSDLDILSGLITNAYPDLSSLFDFSTDTTSLLSDLDFPVSNANILDKLNELADLAGAEGWSFDEPTEYFDELLYQVTFDGGTDYSDYGFNVFSGISPTIQAQGNPNNCYRASGSFSGGFGNNGTMSVEVYFAPDNIRWKNLSFDYYLSTNNPTKPSVSFGYNNGATGIEAMNDGAWHTVNINLTDYFTVNDEGEIENVAKVIIGFSLPWYFITGGSTYDYRIDNIQVTANAGGIQYTTPLIWDDEPELADFDIDINSDIGNEFAFDIDLKLGDYADFNSITVIGGFEETPVDWTYESDGNLTHFDLELPIQDITVYKNTGTDGSPTWTEQSLGEWGKDELTSDGGSKDVLYDEQYHWLLFDSEPSNLSKSIRVTGNIEKPIRVRMDTLSDGDPVFATTIENSSIKTKQDAIAVGRSALDSQSAIRSLTFKTYEPGLKVGQAIRVEDSSRGLDETVIIRRISTNWLGASGHAIFEVSCGDDDYSGVDTMIANNDKRSRNNSLRANISTPTIVYLTDDSGVYLTDDDGNRLYYEV